MKKRLFIKRVFSYELVVDCIFVSQKFLIRFYEHFHKNYNIFNGRHSTILPFYKKSLYPEIISFFVLKFDDCISFKSAGKIQLHMICSYSRILVCNTSTFSRCSLSITRPVLLRRIKYSNFCFSVNSS